MISIVMVACLNDLENIVKYQDAFNKTMLGFINRIQRE